MKTLEKSQEVVQYYLKRPSELHYKEFNPTPDSMTDVEIKGYLSMTFLMTRFMTASADDW